LAIPLALSAIAFKLCRPHIRQGWIDQGGPCHAKLARTGERSAQFAIPHATLHDTLADTPECSAALLSTEVVVGEFCAPNSVELVYGLRLLRF
jgi:hypothetical protein